MKTILLILMLAQMTFSAEHGVASHYSIKSNRGTKTASGEKLSNTALTAAHKYHKFGTELKITNLANNKTAVVKVNDRGPYIKGRIIDVTPTVARKLDFYKKGITKVKVEVINSKRVPNRPEVPWYKKYLDISSLYTKIMSKWK